MPLYREQLESLAAGGCQAEGCDHKAHGPVFLHGRCHPSAGVEVSYHPGSGALRVACLRCHALIAQVAVATQPPGA